MIKMIKTKIINLRKWHPKDLKYIRIDRGTIYGNPYVISIAKNISREKAISEYEKYLRILIKTKKICIKELMRLDGETLACWCKPLPCHGDVIIKILEEIKAGKIKE